MKKKVSLMLLVVLLFTCVNVIAAVEGPEIDCKAYMIYNATDDVVISEYNADKTVYPASITKIMTAIVALENRGELDSIEVPFEALEGLYEKGSRVYLKEEEKLTFDDALAYLLVSSSNDAANAIAISIAGSIDDFVNMMNAKAKELGMSGTNFTNPNGLHDENTYTTARDVVTMSVYAMNIPEFAAMVANSSYDIPATNKQEAKTIFSTNNLISGKTTQEYLYSPALGIKTGTTTPAGLCLSSAADIDGKIYFGVVMGTDPEVKNSQFAAMIKLFKFAPTAYSEQAMVDDSMLIAEIPVRLGKDKDSVNAVPQKKFMAYLPSTFKMDDVTYDFKVVESLDAPVNKGDTVGSITFSYEGKEYVTMDLVASAAVEQSLTLAVMDKITNFFSSTFFKITVAVILGLIVCFITWVILLNRSRRRKKYKSSRYNTSRRR